MKSTRGTRSRPALIVAIGAAVVLALAGCTAPPTADASTSPTTATATATPTPAVTATPAVPVVAAGPAATLQFPEAGSGAVGIASPDGTVQLLGQGGETGTVPIASITKVITSLVVLDAHPLADPNDPGPTITLNQNDLDIMDQLDADGQFTEPMHLGQEVTLHDALAITLLTSANNYAETVAIWAYGSRDAYLAAARAWLASHALAATTLADASGLDPGSASSSADLLRVASIAHANPALASIAGLAEYEQADLGTIANQNILLGQDGVDGLKTGSTSYAGYTLLTSAIVTVGSTPVTLVAVVLGTESVDARFATTRALLASAQAGLREVTLATAGQAFGSYRTSTGGTIDVVATSTLLAVVFGDTPVAAQVELDELQPDAEPALEAQGAVVGTAGFTAGTARYDVPLALASDLT